MALSKSTIILVTGVWQPSTAYKALTSDLEEAGYPVLITNLPSLNPKDPSGCNCSSDAASVRKQFLPTIEEGKDIIILCHSYGRIPAGGAARGLSKSARMKQGDKGGVHPPHVMSNKPSKGLSVITTAKETLLGDVPSTRDGEIEKSLLPHDVLAFESPAPPAAWAEPEYSGKIAFLPCTQDAALPPFVQDLFVDKSEVKWIVKVVRPRIVHS